MREVVRPFSILVLLQGLCLAAGLWIHDRVLIAASQWTSPTLHEAGLHDMGQPSTGAAQSDGSATLVATGTPTTGSATGAQQVGRLFQAMLAASSIAFVWTLGLQSAIAYLLLARVYGEQTRRQSKSDEQSLQHTRDLLQTRDAVIFGLAKLSESRDPETGHHLERISLYSTRLAAALSHHPKYRDVVTPAFVRLISISSALHDIGKVGIEDSVLLKPGSLTPSERFRMQLHAEVGADCIREIESRLGRSNFLEMAREIAYSHHEHWDGNGYPEGLSGDQIPLAARIVAIADVYDALSVRRVYKDPISHRDSVAIIHRAAGRQFDPDLVQVFLEIEPQFEEIARRFANDPSSGGETSQSYLAGNTGHEMTTDQQYVLLAALSECDETSKHLEPVNAGA
jgi:HD-GYP domain-containing protein (c-di-GMP phosphodiesterase class II)